MSTGAGIQVCPASNYILQGSGSNDLLFFVATSNQNLLFGTSNNSNLIMMLSSNGRVGIGKSNPAYTLDVAGSINFVGSLTSNGVPFVSGGGGGGWSNNSSNIFVMGSNVAIGKSNAAYALDVAGDVNMMGTLRQSNIAILTSTTSNTNMLNSVYVYPSITTTSTSTVTPSLASNTSAAASIRSSFPTQVLQVYGADLIGTTSGNYIANWGSNLAQSVSACNPQYNLSNSVYPYVSISYGRYFYTSNSIGPFTMSASNSCTIALYAKFFGSSYANNDYITQFYSPTGGAFFLLLRPSNTSNLNVQIAAGGGTNIANAIQFDQWASYIVVANGATNQYTLYTNGVAGTPVSSGTLNFSGVTSATMQNGAINTSIGFFGQHAYAQDPNGSRMDVSGFGLYHYGFSAAQASNWHWAMYNAQNNYSVTTTTTTTGSVGILNQTPSNALDVTGNISCTGYVSAGNLGMFRNRIINGDMRIVQRPVPVVTGTGNTGTVTTYSIDRWGCEYNITTGGLTQSVVTLTTSDAPYALGFKYSYRVTASTACTNYLSIGPKQCIEGYNIADFNWGSSSGTSVTLSFWLRSNAANGSIINVALRNNGTSAWWVYNINVTLTSSSTWQYVTATIPAPSNGTPGFGTDSSLGLTLYIGGVVTSGVVSAGAWTNATAYSTQLTTNIFSTVNNYVEFTGVQLEKGNIATPFEFRPYAEELRLCQRYCYKNAALQNYGSFGIGFNGNTTSTTIFVPFPVSMYAAPSLTSSAASQFNINGVNDNATATGVSIQSDGSSQTCARVNFTAASITSGATVFVRANNATGTYLLFSAEL